MASIGEPTLDQRIETVSQRNRVRFPAVDLLCIQPCRIAVNQKLAIRRYGAAGYRRVFSISRELPFCKSGRDLRLLAWYPSVNSEQHN